LIPQTIEPPPFALYRSWESGIRNSAVHPSESIAAAASQTASQFRSSAVSS